MLIFGKPSQSEETWMSASDLMTVLMILFLLIAIFYTIQKSEKAEEITKGAQALIETEKELCQKVKEKFSNLINEKKIEVACSPITVTFVHPDFKFATNKCEPTSAFKGVLDYFFPEIINLIHSRNKYVHAIEEVRVEGHTSSEWGSGKNRVEGMASFQNNMKLSQCRALGVVNYCLGLEPISGEDPGKKALYSAREKWAFHNLTANGLSFARPLRYPNYEENKEASRRVEFKLITNTRDIIRGINKQIESGQEGAKLENRIRPSGTSEAVKLNKPAFDRQIPSLDELKAEKVRLQKKLDSTLGRIDTLQNAVEDSKYLISRIDSPGRNQSITQHLINQVE